jgi:hypothetical protein
MVVTVYKIIFVYLRRFQYFTFLRRSADFSPKLNCSVPLLLTIESNQPVRTRLKSNCLETTDTMEEIQYQRTWIELNDQNFIKDCRKRFLKNQYLILCGRTETPFRKGQGAQARKGDILRALPAL